MPKIGIIRKSDATSLLSREGTDPGSNSAANSVWHDTSVNFFVSTTLITDDLSRLFGVLKFWTSTFFCDDFDGTSEFRFFSIGDSETRDL